MQTTAPVPEKTNTNLPELLTRQQVADTLAVSKETIKRWTRDGRLSQLTYSRSVVRYRRDDVLAFLGTGVAA